jgi:hypothetical protein
MRDHYEDLFNSIRKNQERIFLLHDDPRILTATFRAIFDVADDKVKMYFKDLSVLDNEAIVDSITNFLNRDGELHIKYSDDFSETSLINSLCERRKVTINQLDVNYKFNCLIVDEKAYLFQEVNSIKAFIAHTHDLKTCETFNKWFDSV